MKKFISSVLAVLMLLSCLTVCISVPAYAEETEAELSDLEKALSDAFSQKYKTGADKIAEDPNMKLMARLYGYELYCNAYTGEVAYRNVATGEVLTSNPTDFSKISNNNADYTTSNTVTQLLSQLEVSFEDNTGTTKTFFSFVEAANRDQIVVKPIKNGFRVEYTMGRLDTSYLIPGTVLAADILPPDPDDTTGTVFIDDAIALLDYVSDMVDADVEDYTEDPLFLSFAKQVELTKRQYGEYSDAYQHIETAFRTAIVWYSCSDYDSFVEESPALAATLPDEIKALRPTFCTLDDSPGTGAGSAEKARLENKIKTYYPDLNQEMLDEMHRKTNYVQVNEETPVFRMAIEYVLEEDGLSVRLPASSIRFDETKYTLQYVKMLQYFGAGNLNDDGYVFYPDGSGALIDFSDFYNGVIKTSVELSGTVYGEDFAYYDIDTNSKHSEVIRVPVFGIQSTKKATGLAGGFLAILEQGDALADIATSFGGYTHNYASAYALFYPRPSDTYNMTDAISVADNKDMTIVSDKKYNGTYVIKYKMLFDASEKEAVEGAGQTYYNAGYVGMANAYRDYLLANGYMSKMTENDVRDTLPLYVETLGSVETVEKFLSIPVEVDVPLTSFEDVIKMNDRLATQGITNINYRLRGFANGGMRSLYPAKLKWMKSVGGKDGFYDLLDYAREKNIGVYPEFEFSYISRRTTNGVNLKKNAARAVDDRFASKQIYDAVYQQFDSFFEICVSPDSIVKYVKRFAPLYVKYDPIGISVGSLGSDLNSNFDEDNSLNRNDAKENLIEALESVDETYASVMAEGGNIYAIRYLDHVLGMPIDASKYKYESRTVPFLGMVLHGYVNYAGNAINESGDGEYQVLKSIESGALLYYLMAYENTNLMKDDLSLSKYYSVRFDIWFDTIVDQYKQLNDAIGDLQLYNIVDHEFLIAERIAQDSEIADEIDGLNRMIVANLEEQYDALREKEIHDRAIKQIAQNLILSGVTVKEDLDAKIRLILGTAFVDGDQETVDNVFAADPASFVDYYGASVGIYVDIAALTASVETLTGAELTDDQKTMLQKFEDKYSSKDNTDALVISEVQGITYKLESTDSYATDGAAYEKTSYTNDSDRVTMVTYSDGTNEVRFVLNYNTFDIAVRLPGVNGDEAFHVPAYGFQRINGNVLAD